MEPQYPDDFLLWARSLQHRQFNGRQHSGPYYSFRYNSSKLSVFNVKPVFAEFSVLPSHIVGRDWRAYVATRIHDLRLACLRQTDPVRANKVLARRRAKIDK